jgi:hypothetical protein
MEERQKAGKRPRRTKALPGPATLGFKISSRVFPVITPKGF